jgi:hypothetical protein
VGGHSSYQQISKSQLKVAIIIAIAARMGDNRPMGKLILGET